MKAVTDLRMVFSMMTGVEIDEYRKFMAFG